MPVLLSVVRTSDDALRLYLLKSLTELVSVLRQHVRKYLGDLMALVHHYWASGSQLLPVILTLVSEIAGGTLPVTTGVVRS
jgi:FKBP12-rapamycin complex-associated protein